MFDLNVKTFGLDLFGLVRIINETIGDLDFHLVKQ